MNVLNIDDYYSGFEVRLCYFIFILLVDGLLFCTIYNYVISFEVSINTLMKKSDISLHIVI